jgi:hypothetical protein
MTDTTGTDYLTPECLSDAALRDAERLLILAEMMERKAETRKYWHDWKGTGEPNAESRLLRARASEYRARAWSTAGAVHRFIVWANESE